MQPATILPETAEAAEPVTNARLPRCRRLVREAPINRALAIAGPRMQSRCTGESVADEPPYLCASHLSEAVRFLVDRGVVHVAVLCDQDRRQAAAVSELMDLAGRSRDATTMAEQVELNNRMVQVARAEAEERHARSDQLIEDLLAPRPAETDTTTGTEVAR